MVDEGLANLVTAKVAANMDLKFLTVVLGMALKTSGDAQETGGRGALLLSFKEESKTVGDFWIPRTEVPDERFQSIVDQGDVTKGVYSIIILSERRVAGYVLNTNTGPEWREATGAPFAIMDFASLTAEQGGEEPPPPKYVPGTEDLGIDDDFL